jgi:hypothetical protein
MPTQDQIEDLMKSLPECGLPKSVKFYDHRNRKCRQQYTETQFPIVTQNILVSKGNYKRTEMDRLSDAFFNQGHLKSQSHYASLSKCLGVAFAVSNKRNT